MLWPGMRSLDVSAALQGGYITPFATEVVQAIRAQRDEAYVSKIVCYLHVMASNPHPPPCGMQGTYTEIEQAGG